MEGSRTTQSTVADLSPSDHLILYPDSRIIFRLYPRVRCNVSLAIAEPRGIHKKFYRGVRWLWWRYFRILTYDDRLLQKLPNARFLPVGTTWVETDQSHVHKKTRHMSLIASPKRALEGHKLRHRIAEWSNANSAPVDLLGHAYKPFDRKEEGLAPYRFSVVIENSREPSYFTEKLLDAFFCDTVPVYWGAPDIGRFFDTRGMVICDTEEQLQTAISTLNVVDYEQRLSYMPANRQAALAFIDYERNAANIISREAHG
jgi:hypothetical protein